MKKYLCFVLTLFFTLTSANIFAYVPKTLTVVTEGIDSPTLPQTYIRDEFNLMSDSLSLEEYIKDLWTNKTTYACIYDHFKIDYEDFLDQYWQILHNNPEFFWVGSKLNQVRHLPDRSVYDIEIAYNYTDPVVFAEKKAALDAATADILLHITDDMTDFEKVMTVHDYMVLNYSYGESPVQHSIFIMTEKVGVCMGYALAFNHLMNVLKIESTYVPSSEMNHAWNLVKIDGEWYHIDVTFDDPVKDKYAYVRHDYAVLSSNAIKKAEKPHKGFDLGKIKADSVIYDNAPWRNSLGAIVMCNSKMYYISDKCVKDEDGNVIHSDLDGGDGYWNISSKWYLPIPMTGLATYGNCIYYNTDNAIYSYDTTTQEKTKILDDKFGICGILTDRNILKYSKYVTSSQTFVYDSQITLKKEEGPIIGSSIHSGDKIITPIYKEDDTPMIVFCHNNNHNQLFHIDGHGSFTVESETGDIFFWTDKLKPLSKKHHVE